MWSVTFKGEKLCQKGGGGVLDYLDSIMTGMKGVRRNRPLEKSAHKRLGPISPEKSAPGANFSGEIGPNRNFGEIVPIVKFYIYRC